MRRAGGIFALLLALASAYVTYVALALALTPQDSGAEASGQWGYALVPGAATLALLAVGLALLRN